MTRSEYSEFRYIRSSMRKFTLGPGTLLTIRVNASADYKKRLHELYVAADFHPASVRVDRHMFDENMRIIYISGRTWKDDEGHTRSWEELYTPDERKRFAAALE